MEVSASPNQAQPHWPGSPEDYERLFDAVLASCAAVERGEPVEVHQTDGTLVRYPCMECPPCLQLVDQRALTRHALVAKRREWFTFRDCDAEVVAERALPAEVTAPHVQRDVCPHCRRRHESGVACLGKTVVGRAEREEWRREAAAWDTAGWPEWKDQR